MQQMHFNSDDIYAAMSIRKCTTRMDNYNYNIYIYMIIIYICIYIYIYIFNVVLEKDGEDKLNRSCEK